MQMRKENEEDENQAFAQFAYFLHNQWHTKMSLSMHPAHTHTHRTWTLCCNGHAPKRLFKIRSGLIDAVYMHMRYALGC